MSKKRVTQKNKKERQYFVDTIGEGTSEGDGDKDTSLWLQRHLKQGEGTGNDIGDLGQLLFWEQDRKQNKPIWYYTHTHARTHKERKIIYGIHFRSTIKVVKVVDILSPFLKTKMRVLPKTVFGILYHFR